MKNWILCAPADRNTLAMMRFILQATQEAKTYTAERIILGDRKGSLKPLEELLDEWLKQYLRVNRTAEEAPRYTLRTAMREVLENGVKKRPEEWMAWHEFTVEARKGWKTEVVEQAPTMSWDDYLEGKEAKRVRGMDNRSVVPDIATRVLFERGLLRFKWGTVQLIGRYDNILGVVAAQKGVGKEELLRKVERLDFMKVSQTDHSEWKVDFILE